MSHLPLLFDPARQEWFGEAAVIGVAALVFLNLLLFVIVYGRRVLELWRARRTRAFRARFAPLVDEVASGRLDDPEEAHRLVMQLDKLQRAVAATMLLDRLRSA